MAFKVVLFCTAAVLVQSIAGQCLRRVSVPSCVTLPSPPNPPCPPSPPSPPSCSIPISRPILPSPPSPPSCSIPLSRPIISSPPSTPSYSISLPRPISPSPVLTSVAVPSSGGPLLVTSVGPIVPTGISVASEVALGGDLLVTGDLPFLSAVAFEGAYPTAGSAAVSYGCGDGTVGIQKVIGGCSSSLGGLGGCGCGCGK